MEIGIFPISCCFRNFENDFLWIFAGVYDLVGKVEENPFGKSWGQLEVCGMVHVG